MSRALRLVAGAFLAAGPVLAQAKPQAAAPPPKRAAVTAVTSGMVYVGVGRADGLLEGAIVEVLRLGERGRFKVTYLSSHSAACKGDSSSVLPAIGDTVQYVPVATTVAERGEAGAGKTTRTAARFRGPRLRGRLGVRYLGSTDRASGVDLRQPGIELLLNGPIARNAPLELSVDIRSRRTSLYRPGVPTTADGTMGVYQAALRFQSADGPVRAVIGRQYAPTLAGVGLFDGLLLEYQRTRWGGGILAGLAPELGTLALSSDIRQLGAYVQGHSSLGSPTRWSLTAGAMGSYAGSEINREFGFLQATLSSRVVSAIVMQEVDMNRSWKLAAGEPRLSFTSTYAAMNLMPARWISINGGVDNRRNVRLYQDLVTPEQVFDARFRLGLWGGMNLTIGRKLRLGGDARTSTVDGADSLRTFAYSANVTLDRLTKAGFGLRARATRYETPGRGPGLLYSGTVRIAPATIGALEFNGGSKSEQGAPDFDRYWGGASVELFLRRSWFGLATFTREWGRSGATLTTDLLYAGFSYRF